MGAGDAFVTKLNPTGSGLVYSTYLGGSVNDNSNAIAVDAAGNAYVTGETHSFNFPTTPGAFQATHPGPFITGWVTKVNATGTALSFHSKSLSGSAG